MPTLTQALNQLYGDNSHANLVDELEELLSSADATDANRECFEAAFRFFERHPYCELGSPGPLVHWLEAWYPLYLDELLESVNRRPTAHTLWMLNRILNSELDPQTRSLLMSALDLAAVHAEIDSSTKLLAQEFSQQQNA